ncbi:MAG: nitroreductase family protein [Desulfonatronovibrionaceae bacterium]
MDTLECIATRRSIRKYTGEDVSPELVDKLLKAAMSAPSAGDARPWEFVVVREKERLERVQEFNPYAAMAPKAAVGILVCGNLAREKFPGFWGQDCSAAVENLLLAANALGLGAVWTGIYPLEDRVERCRTVFGLPDNVLPLAFVPLGWPAQERKEINRFDSGRIHCESW